MNLYSSETYRGDLATACSATVHIEKLQHSSVLVTGATGTIGSFIVDMLHQCNCDGADITIYAAGRSTKRLDARFAEIKDAAINYVEYDSQQPVSFDFPVDYIVHAGGNAHPQAFNTDPVGTIVGNVNGTYNLLTYAKEHGAKRFCYISSGEVYGQGDVTLDEFEEDYCGPLDLTSSRSCYPNSKRAAETLCASFTKQFGLETVIVRPCHTYGPGITPTDSRANVQFIRNVLNGEDIVLKSDGAQLRSYAYIADCASAILTVLLNGEAGQAYNSANPNARITIAGLAEVIAKCAGRKVIFAVPSAADIANRSPIAKQVLSSKKLEALGWTGRFPVETGIEHTLRILSQQ